MSGDDDVAAYAVARWPGLVRCLVLLGSPPSHARLVARRTLGLVLAEWRERDQWLDLDVHLYQLLLETWRNDRTAWWHDLRPGDDLPADDLPTGDGTGFVASLDRLPVSDRARLVLESVAALSPEQIDDVLGPGVPRVLPRGPELRPVVVAAESVVVGELPSPSELGVEQRRRRRRRGAATVAGLGVLVVLGGAVATAVLPVVDREQDPSGVESREPDPSEQLEPDQEVGRPVVWFGAGALHLPGVTIAVDGVTELVTARDGAVVADAEGRLRLVTYDGLTTEVGRTTPRASFAASSAVDLLAWVEDGRELVVRDLGDERIVLREPLAGRELRVVTIDGGRVFHADADGYRALGPDGVEGRRVDGDLLDVAAGVRALQTEPGRITVLRRDGLMLNVDGRGAQVADDGEHVLTRDPQSRGAGGFTLLDVRNGASVVLPVPGASVLDAAFGSADTVSFVVGRRQTYPGLVAPGEGDLGRASYASFDVVTCGLTSRACRLDARLSGSAAAPLLSR